MQAICSSETSEQHIAAICFHAGFLLGLFFEPEDVGDMFSETSEQHIAAICFHAGFLLGLFFEPEDVGDMFLRNVGTTYRSHLLSRWFLARIILRH
jgi:hypothetical protein